VDAGSTPVAATVNSLWAWIVGDSITEGTAANFGQSDQLASWSYFVGQVRSAFTVTPRDYLGTRAKDDAETVQAQWVNDWLSRRQDWLSRLGKLLTAPEVAAFSPSMKTPAAVHKARHDGRLLAFDLGDRTYFPEFQFQQDGKPAPWVRPLVERLPSTDTTLQFLAAGRTGLKGRSFAELLREGTAKPAIVEAMLQAASELADAEAC